MDKMNRDLDLFSEVVEKLSSEYSTELLTYDGVHLNKQGNTLIANEMLKFFN